MIQIAFSEPEACLLESATVVGIDASPPPSRYSNQRYIDMAWHIAIHWIPKQYVHRHNALRV